MRLASIAARVFVPLLLFPVVGLLLLATAFLDRDFEVGVAWALLLTMSAGAILVVLARFQAGAIAILAALGAWLIWVFVVPGSTAPPEVFWIPLGLAALLAGLVAWWPRGNAG